MDEKGEAVLVLTPSQEKSMCIRLAARKVPISKIRLGVLLSKKINLLRLMVGGLDF